MPTTIIYKLVPIGSEIPVLHKNQTFVLMHHKWIPYRLNINPMAESLPGIVTDVWETLA